VVSNGLLILIHIFHTFFKTSERLAKRQITNDVKGTEIVPRNHVGGLVGMRKLTQFLNELVDVSLQDMFLLHESFLREGMSKSTYENVNGKSSPAFRINLTSLPPMIGIICHGQICCSWDCFDSADMDWVFVHVRTTLTVTVNILKCTRSVEREFADASLAFL
jgi:hypothetical protein